MFELHSEGAFGDDQLYPVEVSKAGGLGTEIEIDKTFTVYPKQLNAGSQVVIRL